MEEEDDTNIMDATNIAMDEEEASAADEEDSHNHHHNPEFLVEQESGDSSIFASDDSESKSDDSESKSDDSESESDVENESDDSESVGHWESYSEDLESDVQSDHDALPNETTEGELLHSGTPDDSTRDIDALTDNRDSTPLGRGMRASIPNPKYYGEEYQFLQHSFESLDTTTREEFLFCAISEFKLSKKTYLLERYLSGVMLLQMSANAGIRKHGKEAEKMLLKEFQQFKNMDVMDVLDPDSLTPEQKMEALGMVNILQEKRDHTPENPSLKV
jgi:Nucleic-acid-binding protein possibly involved in ribosomal biogenesis